MVSCQKNLAHHSQIEKVNNSWVQFSEMLFLDSLIKLKGYTTASLFPPSTYSMQDWQLLLYW